MANRNLLTPENLTRDGFALFGTFANMISPTGVNTFGQPPVEFNPDMLELDTGGDNLSLSVCRVNPRQNKIITSEYHTACGELILPLDGDVLIHVGPPTADDKVPLEKIAVFLVPMGTAVVLKRGVWHHAPFTITEYPVNVLIGLPPRTYADDCKVVHHVGEEQLNITIPQ